MNICLTCIPNFHYIYCLLCYYSCQLSVTLLEVMAVDVMQKKEIHLDHSGIHLMWILLHLNSMDPCIMIYITMICLRSGMRSILHTGGLVCMTCCRREISVLHEMKYHLTLCLCACSQLTVSYSKSLFPVAVLRYSLYQ
jgi:hypothetical protein